MLMMSMGLLYIRTESKKQITYKRKDGAFRLYWISLVFSFIIIFVMLEVFENGKIALYFFITAAAVLALGLPDTLPIQADKLEARSSGKKVVEKGGGILLGASEITIEK